MNARKDIWFLVIERFDNVNDKEITENQLKDYLDDNEVIKFYAFIYHDKDIDESGEEEHKHYHLLIVLSSVYAKSTIINDIAKELMINKNIISARRTDSVCQSIQYLVHMNDKNKYQYNEKDIVTNERGEVLQCIYGGVSSYDLDIPYLKFLCSNSRSLGEVYYKLGIKNSHRYRAIINDLWKERFS